MTEEWPICLESWLLRLSVFWIFIHLIKLKVLTLELITESYYYYLQTKQWYNLVWNPTLITHWLRSHWIKAQAHNKLQTKMANSGQFPVTLVSADSHVK